MYWAGSCPLEPLKERGLAQGQALCNLQLGHPEQPGRAKMLPIRALRSIGVSEGQRATKVRLLPHWA